MEQAEMRITRNKTPNTMCALCGEPLVVGELGANFLPDSINIRRAHPPCLRRWQIKTLPYFQARAR